MLRRFRNGLSGLYSGIKTAAESAVDWTYEKLKDQHRNIKKLAVSLRALSATLRTESSQGSLITGVMGNWLTILATYLSLRSKKKSLDDDIDTLLSVRADKVEKQKIGGLLHSAQAAFAMADLFVLILAASQE